MALCLVIEDMPVTRKIYERMLGNLGFEVALAADVAAGLAICVEMMPDVVLVDWNLPDRDGIDFISELRQLPRGDQPKILMCSIENSIDHIRKAIGAGADEYIMKSFSIDILTEKLRLVGALE